MCCFSGHVEHVSQTQIFARSAKQGRQFIVYSMQIQADEDLAMILPIPVPSGSPDDAVRFISLKDYAGFFDDMRMGWPVPAPRVAARKSTELLTDSAPPLPVVEVGDFGASFVPSVKDFRRLDAQFRLPDATWNKLPQYRDYGFAVFKLRESGKKKHKVHPMAFEFPRANPRRLFFPTVHIHDGQVHPMAEFDHMLFCQTTSGERLSIMQWNESRLLAAQFMNVGKAAGIVDGDRHCYQQGVRGRRRNEDILA